MRVINLDKKKDRRITIMSYGGFRAGKTFFAATAPAPAFISDGRESGWETIQNMDPNQYYDRNVQPLVYAIDALPDFNKALATIRPQVESGRIKTVVIDSLTFHADMVFNAIVLAQQREDPRRAYGDLSNYLRNMRDQVHALPCNIIWLCLEKAPSEENPQGLPMIPGQQQVKFAAGCDYILYHRATETNGKVQYHLHTKRFGPYFAGGRDGGRLPAVMEKANFAAFAEALHADTPLIEDASAGPARPTGKPVLRRPGATNGTAPATRR
jgi:hypothetical protein